MEKIIEKLSINGWHNNDLQNELDVEKVNKLYDFPNEYLQFMGYSNGGEGYIGENYLYLWKIENIEQLNKDYNIQKYLGVNCYGFGSNGGGQCFCFDNKNGNRIIKSYLGDLDYNEAKVVANTFYELIDILERKYVE
jgi:hypothetical protein